MQNQFLYSYLYMGIESFFSSIQENDITNLKSNFTYKLQKRIDSKYLLIDFNSIVHVTSTSILSDLNHLLYQILNKNYKNNNKFKKLIETYDIPLDIDSELEYTDLIEYLARDKMNDLVLNKVEEFVLNMFNNFVNPTQLEYIYIAVDGVPNKSKMIEQKKRRYMGTIINELKHKIFLKYEEELMKEKVRYLYEQNKIEWSKLNISPGTKFMDSINALFSNQVFTKKAKMICKELKKCEYSGTSEFGEGEKKIVDYAYKNSIEGSITIFSPDSDMTLLCLLMSKKFENINILRHNQQSGNYDIINIDLLRKNLFNYVANSVKIDTRNTDVKFDEINVINDIVFILTIFGNDFLPKLESFNVKYDFNKIIDKYTKLLRQNNTYLINKTINQDMFIKLLKILHENEGENLQRMYMSSQYRNYDKLKKTLNVSDNFTQVVNAFLMKLRAFNHQIRNGKVDVNHLITNETDFLDKLIKLTRFRNNLEHTKNAADQREFINDYIRYYKQNNKMPEVAITLRRYSKSLNDSHFKEKLEKTLDKIDPSLKITKYDEEIFKLDNILDEYIKKLNASSINLGYVSIDPKTYNWKTEKIGQGVKKYYYEFFDINNIEIKNPQMNSLLKDYIEGLMWVYNYYYNVQDIKTGKPNIWFYKYSHTPLLTQLYHFMKNQPKNYLESVLKSLDKYIVEEKDFFKPKEHLMYVSPVTLHEYIIPNEYKNKVDNGIDINKIVNTIWENPSSDEIDCRGIMFLNKCHVNDLHIDSDIMESFQNDKKFIAYLNK